MKRKLEKLENDAKKNYEVDVSKNKDESPFKKEKVEFGDIHL